MPESDKSNLVPESQPVPSAAKRRRGLSASTLVREVFRSDQPEQFVRSLPAESLYLAIKHVGVSSSADIIEMASIEQCRLLLDFDCWKKDALLEDNLWEWLALADDEHGLRLLQKFVKFIDLKLVAILIGRYVECLVPDEPSETPPGPGYFTPDKGQSWISIGITDADKHFRLARLLALLFETDADLYYQLLAMPKVATDSMLEEESYNDRNRRLSECGIPALIDAERLNTPLSEPQAKKMLQASPPPGSTIEVDIIDPLVFEHPAVNPLSSMLSSLRDLEHFYSHLTFVMNSAIVHYGMDFCELDQMRSLSEKVLGAINIGLETAAKLSGHDLVGCYEILRVDGLYRLGLSKLLEIRNRAKKEKGTLEAAVTNLEAPNTEALCDSITLGRLDGLTRLIPELSISFNQSFPEFDLQSENGFAPFTKLAQCEQILSWFETKGSSDQVIE